MKALLAVAGLVALTALKALAEPTILNYPASQPEGKTVPANAVAICGRIWAEDYAQDGFYCDVVTLAFVLRGQCPADAFQKVLVWNEQETIIGEGTVQANGTVTVTIDQLQIEEHRTRVLTFGAKLSPDATVHAGKSFGFSVTSATLNAECTLVLPIDGTDNIVGTSVSDETIRALALPLPAVPVGLNHAQQYLGGFRLEVTGTNRLFVDDSILTIEFENGSPVSAITNITVVNDLGEKAIGQTSSDWNPTNSNVVHLYFGSPLQISGTGTNYHVLGNLKSPTAGMRFRLTADTVNLYVKEKNDAFRVLFPSDNPKVECAYRTVVSNLGPQTVLVKRPSGWYVRGLGEVDKAYKVQWSSNITDPDSWQDVLGFTGVSTFTPITTLEKRFFRTVPVP